MITTILNTLAIIAMILSFMGIIYSLDEKKWDVAILNTSLFFWQFSYLLK